MAGRTFGSGDWILSHPRLSGRQGVHTTEQAGNGCIHLFHFSRLPARNWYLQSGEVEFCRVRANKPIGAPPIISGPFPSVRYWNPAQPLRSQELEISLIVLAFFTL